MKSIRNLLLALFAVLSLLLAACGSGTEPAATESLTVADNGPQETLTDTPLPPTSAPEPPTATPEPPTPTVAPTETPEPPTPTAVPPTPAPEIALEDLYGQWGHILFTMELNPDGTYLLTWPYQVEKGYEQPLEHGTFELVEGALTFRPERYEATEDPVIDGCDEGEPYTYNASFSEGDSRFLKISDGVDSCGYRVHQWGQEPIWQLLEKYQSE